MDLHRLTLQAIGPYADEFTVDFGALAESRVFLLEGPTGSGKSTVIDAIVFALYGSLAGENASKDRLRSHHAAPDVEPFVELVFETPAGRYWIRRTPQWERPKARGTGTTTDKGSVTLRRLTSADADAPGDGEAVSSRAQEVGVEIQRIIGLTREQFLQTIVLPQGEFARFLSATGEDRRAVLQSLFGTEIYERTTERLIAARRDAHAAVAAAEGAIGQALAGLQGAAGDDELEVGGAEAAVAGFAAAATADGARRDEARAASAAAEAARGAAVELASALARRDDLLDRKAVLDAAQTEVDGRRSRLEEGAAAALVAGPAAALARAQAAVSAAEEALGGGAGGADGHGGDAGAGAGEWRAEPLGELVERREGVLAEAAGLRDVARVEAALPRRLAALASGRAALVARRSALDAAAETAAARASARGDEVAAIDLLRTQAAALDSATAEQTAARAAVDRLARRDDLAAALARAVAAVAAAMPAATAALDAEAALRRRRLAGMAGEIALDLVDGEACAVCGAIEHPSPAVLLDEHPTSDDIDAAAALSATAEATLKRLAADEAAQRAVHDDVAGQVGDATSDGLAAALTAATAHVSSAESAGRELAAAEAALATADAEAERLAAAVAADRDEAERQATRLESDAEAIAADEERVAATLAGRADSCAELVAGLTAEAAGLGTVIELRRAHEAAVEAASQRSSELAAAVAASPFDSPDAAAVAVLDAETRERLAVDVERHDRARAVVSAGLAEPELAAATRAEAALRDETGDGRPDVDGATAAAESAAVALRDAAEVATRSADRSARATRALAGLTAALEAAERITGKTRAVVRMADIASASGRENLRGVTLGTYVLLQRFTEVIAAANARLTVMSSGRYQLEASEREASARARKAGLALAIRDNATDTLRDPKSFSGGETFYASLSLALGLADIVQAEAGGIDLGTLFVDEGFGTLDPETLEAVMTELGTLSDGGRTVGIVSHVEELKQRVADRIEVRRRPDGSSYLRTTAGR